MGGGLLCLMGGVHETCDLLPTELLPLMESGAATGHLLPLQCVCVGDVRGEQGQGPRGSVLHAKGWRPHGFLGPKKGLG